MPGKFVAFKGPRHIGGGRKFLNDYNRGIREFSPEYYVDIFHVILEDSYFVCVYFC